jgi:hypothetical protein
VKLGRKHGNQAMFSKAFRLGESIRASSYIPPVFDSGPIGSTPHIISDLCECCHKSAQNGLDCTSFRSCFDDEFVPVPLPP